MSAHSTTVRYRVNKKYPGYRVGDDGSVWSCKKQGKGGFSQTWHRLVPGTIKSGHMSVVLCKNGTKRRHLIHRLVLEAFVGPCPPGMEACHFPDRDPSNNRLTNLRWDTRKANHQDAVQHGTTLRGERNYGAKLTEAEVLAIRARHARGKVTMRQQAKRYKVREAAIYDIIHRRTWRHI